MWAYVGRYLAKHVSFPLFKREYLHKENAWRLQATAACVVKCVHELPGTYFVFTRVGL